MRRLDGVGEVLQQMVVRLGLIRAVGSDSLPLQLDGKGRSSGRANVDDGDRDSPAVLYVVGWHLFDSSSQVFTGYSQILTRSV